MFVRCQFLNVFLAIEGILIQVTHTGFVKRWNESKLKRYIRIENDPAIGGLWLDRDET